MSGALAGLTAALVMAAMAYIMSGQRVELPVFIAKEAPEEEPKIA